MRNIQKIGIAGAGNVGRYLKSELQFKGFEVLGFNRSQTRGWHSLDELANELDDLDLMLICLSDDAITAFSESLGSTSCLVAHVSGATEMQALSPSIPRKAVFYPLMSFSSSSNLSIAKVPFCLEAQHPDDLGLLEDMVAKLGAKSYDVSSHQRKSLHLAAVLAHNFSNHLFYKAEKLLNNSGMDFKMLIPLLEESLANLKKDSAFNLQTGPARRNDKQTIARHLDLLENEKDRKIYNLLTQSIKETYDQEL